VKIGRHSARSLGFSCFFHQVVSGCPVRMAIEKCTDYPTVQHARESLMVRFGPPFRDYFLALGKAPDAQSLFVRRAATEADAVRRIRFLQ